MLYIDKINIQFDRPFHGLSMEQHEGSTQLRLR